MFKIHTILTDRQTDRQDKSALFRSFVYMENKKHIVSVEADSG